MGLRYRPIVACRFDRCLRSLFRHRDHRAGPASDRALRRARDRLRALGSRDRARHRRGRRRERCPPSSSSVSPTRLCRKRANAFAPRYGIPASFPLRRVTVNLAPAERRNEGTGFELAIALGILRASGQLRADVTALCLGELALDGALRPVRGTMPRVRHAATRGVAEVLIATANAVEAAACGMESFGFASLYEVVDYLRVGRALLRRRCRREPRRPVTRSTERTSPGRRRPSAHSRSRRRADTTFSSSARPGTGKTMLRATPRVDPAAARRRRGPSRERSAQRRRPHRSAPSGPHRAAVPRATPHRVASLARRWWIAAETGRGQFGAWPEAGSRVASSPENSVLLVHGLRRVKPLGPRLRPRQNVDPDVSGYLPSCAFRVEAPTPGRREGHANRPSVGACGLNRARIDARQPTPCTYGTIRRLRVHVERRVAGHVVLECCLKGRAYLLRRRDADRRRIAGRSNQSAIGIAPRSLRSALRHHRDACHLRGRTRRASASAHESSRQNRADQPHLGTTTGAGRSFPPPKWRTVRPLTRRAYEMEWFS
jgi:hypothetical protein